MRFAGTGTCQDSQSSIIRPAGQLFFLHIYFAPVGMPDQYRYYVLGAFLLGVVLTTAYNKRPVYSQEGADDANAKQRRKPVAGSAAKNDLDLRENLLVDSHKKNIGHIKEGIEGCIGDTPLIKIKSLSDYTGCEILAKAEVICIGFVMIE